MKKFTVAVMTKILGESMKSRLEVISAKDESEALQIYCEIHPGFSVDQIVIEPYRW